MRELLIIFFTMTFVSFPCMAMEGEELGYFKLVPKIIRQNIIKYSSGVENPSTAKDIKTIVGQMRAVNKVFKGETDEVIDEIKKKNGIYIGIGIQFDPNTQGLSFIKGGLFYKCAFNTPIKGLVFQDQFANTLNELDIKAPEFRDELRAKFAEILSEIDLNNSGIKNVLQAKFTEALLGVNFSNPGIKDVLQAKFAEDLQKQNVKDISFKDSEFHECVFQNISMDDLSIVDTLFKHCQFLGISFDGSVLDRTQFVSCDFRPYKPDESSVRKAKVTRYQEALTRNTSLTSDQDGKDELKAFLKSSVGSTSSSFSKVLFRDVTFISSKFESCKFKGGAFSKTTHFSDCKLNDVSFRQIPSSRTKKMAEYDLSLPTLPNSDNIALVGCTLNKVVFRQVTVQKFDVQGSVLEDCKFDVKGGLNLQENFDTSLFLKENETDKREKSCSLI